MAALQDIRKIPIEHLQCREQGHDMHYYIPLDKAKLRSPWGVRRRKRCERCEAVERTEIIDQNGDYSVVDYEYDENSPYNDAKQFTKRECRQEIARRLARGTIELRGGEAKPRLRAVR